ncbi:MAG: hypothetical protein VW981_06345 [Rhodobiaceae bacterium]
MAGGANDLGFQELNRALACSIIGFEACDMMKKCVAVVFIYLFAASCADQGFKRPKEETYKIPEYVTGEITVN